MKSAPIDQFGFLLHDAARLMRRRFELRGSEYGLSAAQWRALVRLVKFGPMPQARLADLLEIEPISVSRLVDRMEETLRHRSWLAGDGYSLADLVPDRQLFAARLARTSP